LLFFNITLPKMVSAFDLTAVVMVTVIGLRDDMVVMGTREETRERSDIGLGKKGERRKGRRKGRKMRKK